MEFYNLDENEFSHIAVKEFSHEKSRDFFDDVTEEVFCAQTRDGRIKRIIEEIACIYLCGKRRVCADLLPEEVEHLQIAGFNVVKHDPFVRGKLFRTVVYNISWFSNSKAVLTISKWINELGLSADELNTTYMKIERALRTHVQRGHLVQNSEFRVEVDVSIDRILNCTVVSAQLSKYLEKKRYNLGAYVKQEYEKGTLICTIYNTEKEELYS